jgi:hypothetical protein
MLERREHQVLRAEAERLTVRAAVVEERSLVAIDHRLGHFGRARDRALGALGDEVMHVIVGMLDRAGRAGARRGRPINT